MPESPPYSLFSSSTPSLLSRSVTIPILHAKANRGGIEAAAICLSNWPQSRPILLFLTLENKKASQLCPRTVNRRARRHRLRTPGRLPSNRERFTKSSPSIPGFRLLLRQSQPHPQAEKRGTLLARVSNRQRTLVPDGPIGGETFDAGESQRGNYNRTCKL